MRWTNIFFADARLTRAAVSAVGDRRASFAVTFSLTVPVLVLLAGLGVDYLTGLSFKSRWDAAADAAALAAVQAADSYVKNNASTMASQTLMANAVSYGNTAGTQAFNANAGTSEATGSVTPTVVVSQSGNSFTATATYVGAVPTHFGGLVGVRDFGVGGFAVASATLATYINYYILVDISQSMGIGDTTTDMTNLYNVTHAMGYSDDNEPGCVFGCHVAVQGRPLTNEQVAHNAGITLRIDSAKAAIQTVVNQAKTNAINGNIQIGIYTLQENQSTTPPNPAYQPMTIQGMTNNYTALTTAVGTIDLGPNVTNGYGDSDMVDSINYFTSKILPTNNGTGYSANSPKNYVFLITDGLEDTPGWCNFTFHCTGVLPSTACAQMQTQATVGVIYTTYLPIYTNNDSSQGYDSEYALLVQPYQSQIQPSLLSCASSSQFFFQADNGPALIAAMNALFVASTTAPVRLTQ